MDILIASDIALRRESIGLRHIRPGIYLTQLIGPGAVPCRNLIFSGTCLSPGDSGLPLRGNRNDGSDPDRCCAQAAWLKGCNCAELAGYPDTYGHIVGGAGESVPDEPQNAIYRNSVKKHGKKLAGAYAAGAAANGHVRCRDVVGFDGKLLLLNLYDLSLRTGWLQLFCAARAAVTSSPFFDAAKEFAHEKIHSPGDDGKGYPFLYGKHDFFSINLL